MRYDTVMARALCIGTSNQIMSYLTLMAMCIWLILYVALCCEADLGLVLTESRMLHLNTNRTSLYIANLEHWHTLRRKSTLVRGT